MWFIWVLLVVSFRRVWFGLVWCCCAGGRSFFALRRLLTAVDYYCCCGSDERWLPSSVPCLPSV